MSEFQVGDEVVCTHHAKMGALGKVTRVGRNDYTVRYADGSKQAWAFDSSHSRDGKVSKGAGKKLMLDKNPLRQWVPTVNGDRVRAYADAEMHLNTALRSARRACESLHRKDTDGRSIFNGLEEQIGARIAAIRLLGEHK